MNIPLDIIGDVHGHWSALEALCRKLGYRVDDDWRHPDGRFPVFLGDLVDRGPESLRVAQHVRDLVASRRAFALMGNHEYNLAAWHLDVPGYGGRTKKSNRTTIEAIERDRSPWEPVLRWFSALPMGLEFPDLRIIHACWHKESLEKSRVLWRDPASPAAPADAFEWVQGHVRLRSPFGPEGLLAGLEGDTADKDAVIPHEDLMKGFEVPAKEPFSDADGQLRLRERAAWWKGGSDLVLSDRPQVFGHYWNCPPLDDNPAPPFPPGHPRLEAWAERLDAVCPDEGTAPMIGDHACVDFHGITRYGKRRACIGALRWPEREIAWASAPLARSASAE